MMRYPFLDLRTVNEPLMAELTAAATRVIESGRYVGGPECEALEAELCRVAGTAHAVGVSNGLDALRLIFKAYIELGRLAPGDEVLVPANTYIASVLAVTDAGLTPVFVDASARTLNMDTDLIERSITPRTRAILTVHLYGRPCYDEAMIEAARRHGLLIVEDNAQAIGATAFDGRPTGGLGDAAAFSFYPTKNIGALGDAGAVTTDDGALADAVRALANYGSERRYENIYCGYNCRLDPIQAAFLRVKLPHLAEENERRRALARVYDSEIRNPRVMKPEFTAGSVWHQYTLLAEDRDRFRAYLGECGVGTDVNYPTPPHLQPCYRRYAHLHLPVAEQLSRSVVCLPVSACTPPEDASQIADIINRFN